MVDRLSPEKRSALMSRVRTRDTGPELALRKALFAAGIRGWRLKSKLPGRPDLMFRRARVCVFVDGAFWHGHPDYYWGQSGQFWDAKIASNRERDTRVTAELEESGWTVVRLWDFEIARDPLGCVERVRRVLDTSPSSVRPGR